jgi:hypothetical protein
MVTTERTRVKMLAAVAGAAMPSYGIQGDFAYRAGDVVPLHPELAKAWTACGHAEPVTDKPEGKGK